MENLNKEEQPRYEQNESSFDISELRKKGEELANKIANEEEHKEQHIAKKITDREKIVTDHKRLVSLLKEADSTLELYDKYRKMGMPENQKSLSIFDDLRELVVSLRKRKEEDQQKYDEIMGDSDVYEKIVNQAEQEDKNWESDQKMEQERKEIIESSNQIEREMELLMPDFDFYEQQEEKFLNIAKNLYKIEDSVKEKDISVYYVLQNFVRYPENSLLYSKIQQNAFSKYIEEVKDYYKKLNIFNFKGKAALRIVLENEEEFTKADKDQAEFEQSRKSLTAKIDEVARRYKGVYEALSDEKEKVLDEALSKKVGGNAKLVKLLKITETRAFGGPSIPSIDSENDLYNAS